MIKQEIVDKHWLEFIEYSKGVKGTLDADTFSSWDKAKVWSQTSNEKIWSDSQIKAEGMEKNPPMATVSRSYFTLRLSEDNFWRWYVDVKQSEDMV